MNTRIDHLLICVLATEAALGLHAVAVNVSDVLLAEGAAAAASVAFVGAETLP